MRFVHKSIIISHGTQTQANIFKSSEAATLVFMEHTRMSFRIRGGIVYKHQNVLVACSIVTGPTMSIPIHSKGMFMGGRGTTVQSAVSWHTKHKSWGSPYTLKAKKPRLEFETVFSPSQGAHEGSGVDQPYNLPLVGSGHQKLVFSFPWSGSLSQGEIGSWPSLKMREASSSQGSTNSSPTTITWV